MRAYFLNISEEERKSIQEKQRSIYESIKIKSKKNHVIRQINESLDMFNRFRKY